MIAHVGGVPAEEMLLPWVGAVGAGVLLARAWVRSLLLPRSMPQAGTKPNTRRWVSGFGLDLPVVVGCLRCASLA